MCYDVCTAKAEKTAWKIKGEQILKQQKYSPWLIVFRVLFTLLTAVLIVFIFERSLQNGAISAQESQRVLLAMQRVLAKFTDRELSLHFVRKLAHFAEYTALGFLLQMCLRVYTRHYVKHISWPLLGGIAVALADETIQLYTPGRSSSVWDVWLDFSGVCSGVFAALLVLTFFHMMKWFILHDMEG